MYQINLCNRPHTTQTTETLQNLGPLILNVYNTFDFKTEPYSHQNRAFNTFKDFPYSANFGEMGTGKSKIAIDIATYKYLIGEIDAVLIVAPNNVHAQWLKEQYPVHCSTDYKSFLWQSVKRPTKYFNITIERFIMTESKKLKVLSTNVEAFQSEGIIPFVAKYVKNNRCFIIIDEATRIKTPTAKRSKTIQKLEKYGQRAILTGTPATKNPFGLWSMFEFLKKNFFECNSYIFQARHGVMMSGVNQRTNQRYQTMIDEKTWNITINQLNKIKEQRNGSLMPDDWLTISHMLGVSEKNVRFIEKQQTFVKYKRLDEIKEKIDPYTFYATKKECLPDLPGKLWSIIDIDMPKEQRKVYNELKSKLLVEYEHQELTVLNKVALSTRLAQLCGGFFPFDEETEITKNGEVIQVLKKKAMLIGKKNAKIERLKLELDELSDFPLIIWARFIPELQMLYEELKKDYNCCLYYGGTKKRAKDKMIDEFKAGEYDIFIANPAAAGYGLNLQRANNAFFYSNSYDVEARLQAEDRINRIGVKDVCLYKDFVFKNSIDQKITKAIVAGRDLNDYFKSHSLRELFNDEEEVEDVS